MNFLDKINKVVAFDDKMRAKVDIEHDKFNVSPKEKVQIDFKIDISMNSRMAHLAITVPDQKISFSHFVDEDVDDREEVAEVEIKDVKVDFEQSHPDSASLEIFPTRLEYWKGKWTATFTCS